MAIENTPTSDIITRESVIALLSSPSSPLTKDFTQKFTEEQKKALGNDWICLEIGFLPPALIDSFPIVIDPFVEKLMGDVIFESTGIKREVALSPKSPFLYNSGCLSFQEQEELVLEYNESGLPENIRHFAKLEILEPWEMIHVAHSFAQVPHTRSRYFEHYGENAYFEYWDAVTNSAVVVNEIDTVQIYVGGGGQHNKRPYSKGEVFITLPRKRSQFSRVAAVLTPIIKD